MLSYCPKNKRQFFEPTLHRLFFVRHETLYILTQDADALEVFASLRYDEIGIALGWLDKLLVHGFQHLEVTLNDHRYRPSSIDRVTLDVADEPLVGVSIHEYLEVHNVA